MRTPTSTKTGRPDWTVALSDQCLFYGFKLERHVPTDHMVRAIDRFVDLSDIRAHLAPFYSTTGRPSIDTAQNLRKLAKLISMPQPIPAI